MPTYEYACEGCGHRFEQMHSIKADPLKLCPSCGKEQLRRLIGGGGGLIFKGSGFYITDYRSDSYKSRAQADSGKSDAGKSDSGKSDAGSSGGGGESKPAAAPSGGDGK